MIKELYYMPFRLIRVCSRIPINLTPEEYQRGQLYCVVQTSKAAVEKDAAVEIIENSPYDDPVLGKGQYTHKVYHIAK